MDSFTLKMKSQPIAHLLNGSVHIYWTLKVHSIWNLWKSGLQECKGNGFFEVGRGEQKFSVGSRKSRFLCGAAAPARIYLPRKARTGEDIIRHYKYHTLYEEDIHNSYTIGTHKPKKVKYLHLCRKEKKNLLNFLKTTTCSLEDL